MSYSNNYNSSRLGGSCGNVGETPNGSGCIVIGWGTVEGKKFALQARDKACIKLTNKLSNGDVKVRQYLNRVIEIIGNYNLL